MSAGEQIRRIGFRRWYERQLILGFGYLVMGFVALILLLAGFEGLDFAKRDPAFHLVVLLIAAGAGTFAVVALRRFLAFLERAELFAASATCPGCSAWGKFEVLAEERTTVDDPPESGRPHWLRVRCRKCERDWRIG